MLLLLLLSLQPPPCLSLLLGLLCKTCQKNHITQAPAIHTHTHTHTLGLTGNRVQQGRLKYSVQNPAVEGEPPVPVEGFP